MIKPPLIDPRTPADVARQVRTALDEAFKGKDLGWQEGVTAYQGAGNALVEIFAQMCGVVIDHINRAPERHFLAFLDMLGNSPIPAQPARVPVTFLPDGVIGSGTLVPAGTQVSAPPPAGSKEPLVFETEQDLWVTPATVEKIRHGKDGTPIDTQNWSAEPQEEKELWLGFSKTLVVGSQVSIYFSIGGMFYNPEKDINISPRFLKWQYVKDGGLGEEISIHDETNGLTKSGNIVFYLDNKDFKPEVDNYWIGVKPSQDPITDTLNPVLNWVATNTVDALQLETIRNEVLGSSNSRPKQVLQTLHPSIVPGQKLEVQEKRVGNPNLPQVWTAWTEVPDFYASSPTDRHYRINRQTGEISFGDGRNGMIPPAGVRNIRMAHYQVTQGSKGNIAAKTLKTLLSSVNGVSKIENRVAAIGGADAETQEAMMERAPKRLRHRNRAVTVEDFEDLAKEASTEVAIAKCVPLVDLAADPLVDATQDANQKPGHVSVIIVPHSTAPQPQPSLELLGRVRSYLGERCMENVSIDVVGVSYLPVTVNVLFNVDVRISESDQQRVKRSVKDFLHPLTGNGGSGWRFGVRPYKSDIYAVLISESGIASIELPDFDANRNSIGENQIICAGEIKVNTP